MRSEKSIQKKKCFLYKNGKADALLIQAINGHDLELLDQEVKIIESLVNKPFMLAAFLIDDWNCELSPWEAPAVFGRENFGSGAAKTLSFITDSLLPELYGAEGEKRCYLGGYSLSGLFALWSAYQTNHFYGIAAVSPSVWFPGWDRYVESNNIWSPSVYLSLGDKEEKTRNKTMAAVGKNIRRQYELLCNMDTVKRCELEWNPGNHFVDSERRTAKGFAWLLNESHMTNAGGTMRKNKIISALIGLVGACNNNPKTENTDLVVIKALSFSARCSGCGDEELQRMIDEIYVERNVIAPGCAQCAMPCGNTSDYDMERIYHAADDIRTAKMDIISELCDAACGIHSCQESGLQPSVDMEIFYKALSYLGYDLNRKALLSLLAEIQGMNREIEKIRSTKDNWGEKPYET